MNHVIQTISGSLVALAVLVLSGCATGRQSIREPSIADVAEDGQALVIVMRPASFGAATSSAIFDSTGEQNELIAVLGPKEKTAYYCDAGERLFMVIAENADFMEANLEAGKVYYAIVTPRMGVWKARFSLHPFKADHAEHEFRLDSPQLRKWLKACHYVLPNRDAEEYGRKSAGDIATRRAEFAGKWAEMLEKDKQWRRLSPGDGVDSPIQ